MQSESKEYEVIPVEIERKLRAYLCACCRLIEHKLPPISLHALQVAEDYNQGLVSSEMMHYESRRLLQHLIASEQELGLRGMGELDSAIRCVLCCLFDRINMHEAYESFDWGRIFCNRLENHSAEQKELFDATFGHSFQFEV